jgi:GMP synthase-like glutamine amidotransferase
MLECDTPLPKTDARYHGYGGVFEALLKAGARDLGRPDPQSGLQISRYQVELHPENYPDLQDVDAILITGSSTILSTPSRLLSLKQCCSEHNSFDDSPWIQTLVSYVAKVLAQDRVRTIGVCFGHQIVGRAMGVKVGRNPEGWESAVHDIQLTAKGKEIFQKDSLVRFVLLPIHSSLPRF